MELGLALALARVDYVQVTHETSPRPALPGGAELFAAASGAGWRVFDWAMPALLLGPRLEGPGYRVGLLC